MERLDEVRSRTQPRLVERHPRAAFLLFLVLLLLPGAFVAMTAPQDPEGARQAILLAVPLVFLGEIVAILAIMKWPDYEDRCLRRWMQGVRCLSLTDLHKANKLPDLTQIEREKLALVIQEKSSRRAQETM